MSEGEGKNNKKRKAVTVVVVIALLTTITNIFVITMFFLYQFGIKKANDSKNVDVNMSVDKMTKSEMKEAIKEKMSSGTGTLDLLRWLYPENIVVYEGNKYLYVPIDKSIEKSKIQQENIKQLENGEIQYIEDGETISHKGIDVSKFQGEIDWEKVAQSGVEYAIIRVGYRGYGNGTLVEDEYFQNNIKGATQAGIKVGVYFFTQSITQDEAVEEANFVLDRVKDYNIQYPIVIDSENISDNSARTKGLSTEQITDYTIAFCERIKEAGYTPMVYANLRWYMITLDFKRLTDYDIWYAYYDPKFYFPYKVDMWQYSESGVVDGINGKVDLNISFKDYN